MGYMIKNRQLQSGDSGVVFPTGTTSTRPGQPVDGQIRFNSTAGQVEYYASASWHAVAAAGPAALSIDDFTGNGAATQFQPMSFNVSDATQIMVFVGQLYQIPNDSYTVDGSNIITFSEAIPLNVPVNIIHVGA